MRALLLLDATLPGSQDLDRLTLFDYVLIHTADFGGPSSLHPDTPLRAGELGIKRQKTEQGLRVMLRAELVEADLREGGIQYRATEEAYTFIRVLQSRHLSSLLERARWTIAEFSSYSDADLSVLFQSIVGRVDSGSTAVEGS